MSPVTIVENYASGFSYPAQYEVARPMWERVKENLESIATGVPKGDFRDAIVREGLCKLATWSHYATSPQDVRNFQYEEQPKELTYDEIVLLGSTLASVDTEFSREEESHETDAAETDLESSTVTVRDALYKSFATYCARPEVYLILSSGFAKAVSVLGVPTEAKISKKSRAIAFQKAASLGSTVSFLSRLSFDFPEVAENVFQLSSNYITDFHLNPALVETHDAQRYIHQIDLALTSAGEVFHILANNKDQEEVVIKRFGKVVNAYLKFRQQSGINYLAEVILDPKFNFGRVSYKEANPSLVRVLSRREELTRANRIRKVLNKVLHEMRFEPQTLVAYQIALNRRLF